MAHRPFLWLFFGTLTLAPAIAKADVGSTSGSLEPGSNVVAATGQPAAELAKPAPAEEQAKARAQKLLTQGLDRIQTFEYQAALDFFLGAYKEYQSPKILLNIGATLRVMGRTADAANTYQLYIEDPETNADRIAEIKKQLLDLDSELVVARVIVEPSRTDVSIDGGPWVPVGERLLTRLTPGIHMLRGRKEGYAISELSINTFEGETRDITLTLGEPLPVVVAPVGTEPAPPKLAPVEVAVQANLLDKPGEPPKTETTAWLVTGTKAERGGTQTATVVDVNRYLPNDDFGEDEGYYTIVEKSYPKTLGLAAQMRIDAKNAGFGFSGGVTLELSPRWQLEAAIMLTSENPGFYFGARGRLLTGPFRPYLAIGEPFFLSDDASKLRVGGRIAGGIELRINGHLGVTGELGLERFFNNEAVDPNAQSFKGTYFVPLIGIEGRL